MNTLVLDYEADADRINQIFEFVDQQEPVPGLGYVMQYTIEKNDGRIEVCVSYIPEGELGE